MTPTPSIVDVLPILKEVVQASMKRVAAAVAEKVTVVQQQFMDSIHQVRDVLKETNLNLTKLVEAQRKEQALQRETLQELRQVRLSIPTGSQVYARFPMGSKHSIPELLWVLTYYI